MNKNAGKYDIMNPAQAANHLVKKVDAKNFNWQNYLKNELKNKKKVDPKMMEYNFPKEK